MAKVTMSTEAAAWSMVVTGRRPVPCFNQALSLPLSRSLLSIRSFHSFLPFCDPTSYRISIVRYNRLSIMKARYLSVLPSILVFLGGACFQGNWGTLSGSRLSPFDSVWLNISVSQELDSKGSGYAVVSSSRSECNLLGIFILVTTVRL